MSYTTKYFRDLPIGTRFRSTPTTTAYEWLKVSTRTARLNGNGAVFYFSGQRELCHVDVGHWEEMARALPSKENDNG